LKNQARSVGADAVIDLKFETYTVAAVFSDRVKHAMRASGTAVVFTSAAVPDTTTLH